MDYRIYTLDDDGHIVGVREIECASDEEAKQKAAALLDGQDLEVWHRERRVEVLKHHTRH